jgi:hypothetical protein
MSAFAHDAKVPSLSETVGAFCRDLLRLRNELNDAHVEIRRLRAELGLRPSAPRTVIPLRLRALRRQVSFHCHPDRGGDERLMKKVNALFDYLESAGHLELPPSLADPG